MEQSNQILRSFSFPVPTSSTATDHPHVQQRIPFLSRQHQIVRCTCTQKFAQKRNIKKKREFLFYVQNQHNQHNQHNPHNPHNQHATQFPVLFKICSNSSWLGSLALVHCNHCCCCSSRLPFIRWNTSFACMVVDASFRSRRRPSFTPFPPSPENQIKSKKREFWSYSPLYSNIKEKDQNACL